MTRIAKKKSWNNNRWQRNSSRIPVKKVARWRILMFLNSNILFQYCSNLLGIRNLQEPVKKAFCYPKLLWPFAVWINCSSDLKNFANSWPLVSNFNFFSQSQQQLFLTVDQNNFGNKIPIQRKIKIILKILTVMHFDRKSMYVVARLYEKAR